MSAVLQPAPSSAVEAHLEPLTPERLPAVLAGEITQAIKAADRGAAYLEATRLAGFSEAEARRLFGRDPGLPGSTEREYLTPWTAAKAEKQFLARFARLHR